MRSSNIGTGYKIGSGHIPFLRFILFHAGKPFNKRDYNVDRRIGQLHSQIELETY